MRRDRSEPPCNWTGFGERSSRAGLGRLMAGQASSSRSLRSAASGFVYSAWCRRPNSPLGASGTKRPAPPSTSCAAIAGSSLAGIGHGGATPSAAVRGEGRARRVRQRRLRGQSPRIGRSGRSVARIDPRTGAGTGALSSCSGVVAHGFASRSLPRRRSLQLIAAARACPLVRTTPAHRRSLGRGARLETTVIFDRFCRAFRHG